MTNELWWYVARSCGIVGWALLTLAVVWGLAVAGRFRKSVTPAWLLDLHRHLGGLALVFVALHIVGLSCDKYIHFGLAELFVPLASAWRPGAVSWGVAGLYLLVAVELTSLARRALPRRVWRATHMLSFPLFAVSTVHLWQAGTDAHSTTLETAVVVVSSVVILATVLRVASDVRRTRRATLVATPVTLSPPVAPVAALASFDVQPAGHEVMSPTTNPEDRFRGPAGGARTVATPTREERRAAIAAARAKLERDRDAGRAGEPELELDRAPAAP